MSSFSSCVFWAQCEYSGCSVGIARPPFWKQCSHWISCPHHKHEEGDTQQRLIRQEPHRPCVGSVWGKWAALMGLSLPCTSLWEGNKAFSCIFFCIAFEQCSTLFEEHAEGQDLWYICLQLPELPERKEREHKALVSSRQ